MMNRDVKYCKFYLKVSQIDRKNLNNLLEYRENMLSKGNWQDMDTCTWYPKNICSLC